MNNDIVQKFLYKERLDTYDPFDIWKSKIGLFVKKVFYTNKWVGLIPAAIVTVLDILNNSLRFFYKKQEYPIVRALAVQILLNQHKLSNNDKDIYFAKKHLLYLLANYSQGYSGLCWGLNFPWMSKNGYYDKNMPHVTHTPYVLEALIKYSQYVKTDNYNTEIKSIFNFLEKDLIKQINTDKELALSYAPINEPRVVINANSYAMYMYSLLLNYFPDEEIYIKNQIQRIYNFLVNSQNDDGSWNYYNDKQNGNFIDCFHSIFVLKNIIKTNEIIKLNYSDTIISNGLSFIEENFVATNGLYKRFALTDKLNIVKYDLYDNAEMLGLYVLLKKEKKAKELKAKIEKKFMSNEDTIYSNIILGNIRINKNFLRWAVCPYLFASSQIL